MEISRELSLLLLLDEKFICIFFFGSLHCHHHRFDVFVFLIPLTKLTKCRQKENENSWFHILGSNRKKLRMNFFFSSPRIHSLYSLPKQNILWLLFSLLLVIVSVCRFQIFEQSKKKKIIFIFTIDFVQ